MPDNSTIRAGLVAAFVAALVAAGISALVAQQIANSLKLCYQETTINGQPTKNYVLANPCPSGWQEAKP